MASPMIVNLTERQVQREILRMCGTVFPDVFIAHVPNGSHLSGTTQNRAMQMGALKGDGLKVGFPDLICIWKGGVGFLEVKRPKGGQMSLAQEMVLSILMEMGHHASVVTSAIEAQEALLAWGAPAKPVRWST
jgi:hypothetical protein